MLSQNPFHEYARGVGGRIVARCRAIPHWGRKQTACLALATYFAGRAHAHGLSYGKAVGCTDLAALAVELGADWVVFGTFLLDTTLSCLIQRYSVIMVVLVMLICAVTARYSPTSTSCVAFLHLGIAC
jgi:hypothetical protein